MEPAYEWLIIPEAAKRLGVTPQAIRKRIKRGTMQALRNNRGQEIVQIPVAVDGSQEPEEPPEPAGQLAETVRPQPRPTTVRTVATDRDREIDRLQAAHAAHVATLERQLAAITAQSEREIERLCGQFAAERSFWTERSDAAEMRAEATERLLFEALGTLERAIRPVQPRSVREWILGQPTK